MATTNFVSGTVVEASWLNDVDAAVYETLPKIGVHINQFSPAGDGTTDDLTPLTNFFNSAIANPGVPHYLGNATYATSSALPSINVSGVKIYGSGPSSNHDSGSINGSCIIKIGAASGTMLTVSPTSGASNQRLDGVVIDGVAFNGNQKAAKGLLIKSVRNSFFNCYAEECTTSNFELDVVASLVDARDLQDCVFHLYARDLYSGGACLRLLGDATANVSLNKFDIVDVVHSDATAIVCQNPDNNIWGMVRVFRQVGGTATNSIEWQGGASVALATRNETYCQLTTTVAAIAKGTGTYTVGAHDILIQTLDLGNSTPVPTVETGATVAGVWVTWTPTISASSGTITTSSAVARYKIDPLDQKTIHVQMAITITTNGTGATALLATLPITSENNSIPGTIPGKEVAATGRTCVGHVAVNSTSLIIHQYDGTYPAADGRIIVLNGVYKKA